MRPIRLEMTGFAAFREPAVVDFEGHELLAFTGPTGAGKSSIIDGIAFALFGSVARYGNENLIAPIVNTLSTEARVRLDFSLGNNRYSAVRVVRRTATGASTKEARLETMPSDGGEAVVLAGTAAEVTKEVEALLGLSFAQFTKTIVLPQGDFARFLTETSGDRQSLLRRLLGLDVYASMGVIARQRAKEAAIEAEATRAALGTAEIVTDAALTRLTKAAEKLGVAVSGAEETQSQLVEALVAEQATEASLDQIDASLSLLKTVAIPEAAVEYGSDVEAADKAVVAAQKRLDAAMAKRTAATEALEALTPVDELDDAIALRDRADELAHTCKDLDAAAQTAAAELDRATKAVATIEKQLSDARQELDHARVAAGAAGIAATLAVGDECPVCARVIDELPQTHAHDVSQLESLVAQAEAAEREARSAEGAAATAATTAQLNATIERDALNTTTERLVDVPTRSQLTSMAKRVETASSELDDADEVANGAAAELEEAADARSALDDRASELARDFVAARDMLSFLEPPVPAHDDVIDNWHELVEWSATQAKALTAEQKEVARKAKSDEAAVAALKKEMAKHAKPFEVDPLLPASEIHAALLAEHEAAVALADDAAFRKQRDAANAERIIELDEEAVVSAELGKLLNTNGFEKWLMEDVMRNLAERATERLHVLSSGAYSLTTDGSDFAVTDHRNADEVRNARTLSGGETFLASLSLALALADSITEMASTAIPSTESVFLDEGFGTLDGETLDVVATAIEELGAAGRLVCIVTHISELADRLPHHVRVTRGPTGSTISQDELALGVTR